jgi:NADPH:quinone reductase-like Zn-dependent oxidoreductase
MSWLDFPPVKCTFSYNRATMINGIVSSGQNVLVTGAGGGVAVIAIQLCIAKGANVYVTSGSDEKIKKTVELGARGGVNYKSSKCHFSFYYLRLTTYFVCAKTNGPRSLRICFCKILTERERSM